MKGSASALYYELTGRNEFYNIMPIRNIPSVLKNGILCFDEAMRLSHFSVADEEVQARRNTAHIPNGERLHAYANTYFDARNPMMYRLKEKYKELCVLRIKSDILDIENAVVADKNASSRFVRFYIPIEGIGKLDYDTIFCESWLDENEYEQKRKKSIKCAEVLVPKVIDVENVIGAYVADESVKRELSDAGFYLPTELNPKIFFRG